MLDRVEALLAEALGTFHVHSVDNAVEFFVETVVGVEFEAKNRNLAAATCLPSYFVDLDTAFVWDLEL